MVLLGSRGDAEIRLVWGKVEVAELDLTSWDITRLKTNMVTNLTN